MDRSSKLLCDSCTPHTIFSSLPLQTLPSTLPISPACLSCLPLTHTCLCPSGLFPHALLHSLVSDQTHTPHTLKASHRLDQFRWDAPGCCLLHAAHLHPPSPHHHAYYLRHHHICPALPHTHTPHPQLLPHLTFPPPPAAAGPILAAHAPGPLTPPRCTHLPAHLLPPPNLLYLLSSLHLLSCVCQAVVSSSTLYQALLLSSLVTRTAHYARRPYHAPLPRCRITSRYCCYMLRGAFYAHTRRLPFCLYLYNLSLKTHYRYAQ